MMKDKKEKLLFSYKVIESKCWQENSYENLNKRPINTPIIYIGDSKVNHLEDMIQENVE